MSDIESIESESIHTTHSGDDSGYYHPEDNDQEIDSKTKQVSNFVNKNTTKNNNNNNNKQSKNAQLTTKLQDKDKKKRSQYLSASSNSYDDPLYTQTFADDEYADEEFDNDENVYSDTFEHEVSSGLHESSRDHKIKSVLKTSLLPNKLRKSIQDNSASKEKTKDPSKQLQSQSNDQLGILLSHPGKLEHAQMK